MRIRSGRDLGILMREARRRRGLSQRDVAELVGVSRQWVASAEGGHSNPGLTTVLQALELLELQVDVTAGEQSARTSAESADETYGVDLDDLLNAHRRRSS